MRLVGLCCYARRTIASSAGFVRSPRASSHVVEPVADNAICASKNSSTAASCSSRGFQRVHALPERLRRQASPRSVPADVLARSTHAREFAVKRVVRPRKCSFITARTSVDCAAAADARRSAGNARSRGRSTGRPCAARPIMTASAPVMCEHVLRLFRRGDVAVGDHRNRHRRLDRRDRFVFGVAAVAIGAGAAVHGQHRDAGVLGHVARCVSAFLLSRSQPVRISA